MRLIPFAAQGKYYLSGIDWIISAFDYTMKKTTCSGNVSQIVLELDSIVNHEVLEDRLCRFTKELPVLYGNIVRNGYNLAPYWRVPKNGKNSLDLKVYYLNTSSSNDILPFLEKIMNNPFKDEHEHILFNLIQINNKKSYLAMTFDHRLFDAHGAEAFLDLFQQYLIDSNDPSIFEDISLTSSSGLSEWRKKFYAGKNVNRTLISLSKTTFDLLPCLFRENRSFKFKVITFDLQETKVIYDNAYREAAYLMEMSYLLATVIQGVRCLFNKKKIPVSNFLIGVSVDMRAKKEIKQKLFFNHWSYLFFQINVRNMNSKKELINIIKHQMYEQVKANITKNIAEASFLIRIVPLSVLGKWLGKKPVSFVFSYMNKSFFSSAEFIGVKVENLFHMPCVPVSPGFGFFFNYFNGRLNLVISYIEGLIQDDEIVILERDIRDRMEVH